VPYLSSTLFVASLVVAFLLSLTAWLVLATALWPGFVARSADAIERRPFTTAALGVPGVLVAVLVPAVVANVGPLVPLGLVLGGLGAGFGLAGVAGLALRVGRALPSPRDEGRDWPKVLRAGVVLELALLLPLLGWFVVLPITLLLGMGAAIRALGRGARATGGG
jgi:hypothetical protein